MLHLLLLLCTLYMSTNTPDIEAVRYVKQVHSDSPTAAGVVPLRRSTKGLPYNSRTQNIVHQMP
jgi:hypothetical protein